MAKAAARGAPPRGPCAPGAVAPRQAAEASHAGVPERRAAPVALRPMGAAQDSGPKPPDALGWPPGGVPSVPQAKGQRGYVVRRAFRGLISQVYRTTHALRGLGRPCAVAGRRAGGAGGSRLLRKSDRCRFRAVERNETQPMELQDVSLWVHLPHTKRVATQIRKLLPLIGRKQLPSGDHVLAASVLSSDAQCPYYATLQLDRQILDIPEVGNEKYYRLLLSLRLKPSDEPPEELVKNLKVGRHFQWLMGVLSEIEVPDPQALASVQLHAKEPPSKAHSISSPPVHFGGRPLELRGAEYQAPMATHEGVVRFAWVEQESGGTRIEVDFFTTSNFGDGLWERMQQEALAHLRTLA